MKNHVILGIETSCDETSAAVYSTKHGLQSHLIYSQIDLHKQYGGVLPEAASRQQLEKIWPIVAGALEKADCTLDDITAIAVTHKPGLPGSLLVGVNFAKSLAWAKNKQLIGINHLEGHAFSAFLQDATIPFPHICITASGGHTAMYIVHDFGDYKVIGHTMDDAAGEAFDKISKLIGLGYPGGPEIERRAKQMNFQDFFNYPRAKKKTLDFSFSGLKTAVLYDLVKRGAYNLQTKTLLDDSQELKNKVASSLLVCIADVFEQKLKLAFKEYPHVKALTFVGGVACNKYIKQRLTIFSEKRGKQFFSPRGEFCTDNGAMIAYVGHYKAQKEEFSNFNLDILR